MHESEMERGRVADSGETWAIVLAGGEGQRLRPVTRRMYGDGRPKQYAALTGVESLLRQTLRRVAMVVPPERTVVVSRTGHTRFLTPEMAGLGDMHVLLQPSDRGTAAGVLLAAHWIGARARGATLVVLPSDHFVADDAGFMGSIAHIAVYAREHAEWLVTLGARPTEPDPDRSWLEPGECLGSTVAGPVYRIERFHERTSVEGARRLFVTGALWSTLVFSASADALVEAGRRCVPLLHDRLVRLALFFGTQYEAWALRQAYLFAPTADFCQVALQATGLPVAVAEGPAITWLDLGTPEHVSSALGLLAGASARVAGLQSTA